MPKYFAALDTNIPFRFITQGLPTCKVEDWDALTALVEQGQVTLLVPEVVVLELEKLYTEIENNLEIQIDNLEKAIRGFAEAKTNKFWNEATDLLDYLASQMKDWKEQKLVEANHRHGRVQTLFTSKNAVKLNLDNGVILRANRRRIAGRTPPSEGNYVSNDLFIIESLISHFHEIGEDDQLLLCSENRKDFGLSLGRGYTFHPHLRKGLPPVELIENLAAVVNFVKDGKTVEEPEAVREERALERERRKEIKDRSRRWRKRSGDPFTQRQVEVFEDAHGQYRILREGEHVFKQYMLLPELNEDLAWIVVSGVNQYEDGSVSVLIEGDGTDAKFAKLMLGKLGQVRIARINGKQFTLLVSAEDQRYLDAQEVIKLLTQYKEFKLSKRL